MTASGRGLLTASVVLLAGGYALGYDELLVLGVAGLLVLVFALVFVAVRPGLEVERRIEPDRVMVGETAEGLVTLTNAARRSSPSIVCREVVGSGAIEVVVPRLVPSQAITLPYPLPTDRRAVVTVGPLFVARSDPFCLLERRTAFGQELQLWVHPRTHAVAPLPAARHRDQEGITDESQGGERVFHALREYVIGDDLRRVHWKATAHSGTLMVREHVDPARPDATIVLDDRRSVLDAAGFELAIEAVASVLLASMAHGFPVRLRSCSGHVGNHHGATLDRGSLLDLLAGATQHETPELANVLEELLAGGAGRALVFVTGAIDAADLTRLAVAGRRFDSVIVVSVVAPDDTTAVAAPAGVSLVRVTDAETFVAGWNLLR